MIRKILLILGGIGFALAVAAVVVPMFVDPNNFKDAITRQLQETTGYRVVLDGDISMRVLPFARLRAEKVSIFSPVSGNSEPFAKLPALDVGVSLLPLLQGKVDIKHITLKNPELRLVKDRNKGNWLAKQESAYPVNAAAAARAAKAANKTVPNVVLGGIEITDGVLTYQDMDADTKIELTALNLKVAMDSLRSPLDVQAKAMLNGEEVAIEANLGSLGDLQDNRQTPFSFAFASKPLTISGKGGLEVQLFTGSIEAKSASLADAGAWLSGKPKAAGTPAISLDVKGKSNCSPARCGLIDSRIVLNGSEFTGGVMANLAGAKPNITADLSTDALDITPYMAPQKQAQLQLVSSAYAAEARWSAAPMDLSALEVIDGNIVLNAKHFVAQKFVADNVLMRIRINGGNLAAEAGFAGLYKGKGNGTVNIGTDGHLSGMVSLDGVATQPLLMALSDNDRFSGKLNTKITFKSSGKSQQTLVSNLSGDGVIGIDDGSIKGIDIAGMVRNVKSAFTEIDTSQRKTDFAEMGGTFSIANGIVSNTDLTMKAPLFRVSGAGTVDLPNYSINYKLTPQLVDTLKGQGGKDKEGLGVPILITGSLDNPSYAPDVRGAIEDAIKNPEKVKGAVKNAKEFLKDKNSIKDLKGMFKGL